KIENMYRKEREKAQTELPVTILKFFRRGKTAMDIARELSIPYKTVTANLGAAAISEWATSRSESENDFSHVVLTLRTHAGEQRYSQKEFAQRVGISKSFVDKMEDGLKLPSSLTIYK